MAILDGTERGPNDDAGVGPRFRREPDAPDRCRMGRTGKDTLGVHPRGREDRDLFTRLHDELLQRQDRTLVDDRDRVGLGRRRTHDGPYGDPLGVAAIVANGTPEQVMEWVPQCYGTPDDIKLAAFGVSEPDAGSDVSSLRTRAVYDEANDEWVLNGTKTWISNGGIANLHVIVASVEPGLGSRGQASFIVPDGTKGIRLGQKFKKMGIRRTTGEVVLEDCRIPGRCLLGGKEKLDEKIARAREGKRSQSQAAMATFEASRPAVGAQALGIARAAYEYALDYAKERKQFGRAIIDNQAIAFKLADMKMHIDAARLLIWRASWIAATRKPFLNGEGSMSKLYAGETAVKVTEEAIQILGGYGYIREYPVERWHRDSKIYTIFEGTSEIQRLIISRAISGVHIR